MSWDERIGKRVRPAGGDAAGREGWWRLDVPVQDLRGEFIGGDFGERGDEWGGGKLGADLLAQLGGEVVELREGDFVEVAPGDFGFELAEEIGLELDALFELAEGGFEEGVELEGFLVLEFRAELAAPVEDGVAVDVEFLGDAEVAPALGAEGDELGLFFEVLHSFLLPYRLVILL